ncbi:MAG: hypothetical protein IT445_01865 [Phycisphaeraceae bacterium]|nr:hypothetical protein [Phycisphaeraceae bacterium]
MRHAPFIVLLCLLTATPGFAQRSPYIESLELNQTPLREAFEIWARQAGVPLVVAWQRLEEAGIDPDRPVSITLNRIPAATALRFLMSYAAVDGFTSLVLEVQPGFVEMMTREQALRRSVIRVYDIRDLLMEVTMFTDAPSFDLQSALSNTNSGGGGGGGGGGGSGQGLFGNTDQSREQERPMSKRERGEQIAQLIRDTVEPDIWLENGGQYASIRYFNGKLIVKAPQFVHGQVGRRL